MKYDISKSTAPQMPTLGKGTECIKILLSQTSKDMHEPLVPMLFPVLGAHISGAEFQYSDNKYYELCGQMGHLIGPSGIEHASRGGEAPDGHHPAQRHAVGRAAVNWLQIHK